MELLPPIQGLSPYLAMLAGLLLWLSPRVDRVQSEPNASAMPPVSPHLIFALAALLGLSIWGLHRPWSAFLTPTRAAEATFLAGILLLGALATGPLRHLGSPRFWMIFAPLGAAATLWIFANLPSTLGLSGLLDTESSLGLESRYIALALLVGAPLLLAPMVALSQLSQRQNAGREVLLGLSLGLVSTNLLLPALGTTYFFWLLTLLWVFASLFIMLQSGKSNPLTPIIGGIALLTLVFGPSLSPQLLYGAIYPQLLQREGVRRTLTDAKARNLLYVSEDADGGTVVFDAQPSPSLVIGGAPIQSSAAALDDTRFAAYLPTLLHPAPKKAAVLGPGVGVALDALRRANLDAMAVANNAARIDILEYFGEVNRQVLADPAISRDGEGIRAHLKAHGAAYDIIVSPGLPLWTVEGSLLHSASTLELIRNALTENGLYVLNLPLEALAPSDLDAILSTFTAIFPESTAWLPPSGSHHLILMGAKDSIQLPYLTLLKGLTGGKTRSDLSALDIQRPEDLLSHLLMGPDGLKTLSTAPLLTDFRPLIDLSLPRAPHRQAQAHPLESWTTEIGDLTPLITELEEGPTKTALFQEMKRAQGSHQSFLALLSNLGAGAYDQAVEAVLNMGPRNDKEIETLIRPYIQRAKQDMAIGLLDEAQSQLTFAAVLAPRNPEPLILSAQALEQKGDRKGAIGQYRKALERDNSHVVAQIGLADLLQEEGLYQEAINLLEAALKNAPTRAVIAHNLGELYRVKGELRKSEVRFEQATLLDRSLAAAHAGLASIRLNLGEAAKALPSAHTAVRLEENAIHFEVLGLVLLELGDKNRARSALVQCLLRDPDSINCLGAMGIVYAQDHQYDRAQAAWEKILEMAPENAPAQENLKRLLARQGRVEAIPAPAPTTP